MNTLKNARYIWSIESYNFVGFFNFMRLLIGLCGLQAPRRENVVRGGATGGRSRMRRRPAAGGASTSSAAATAEGLLIGKNVKFDWFVEHFNKFY